ncbi:hypothetical protein ACFLYX_02190 [Chloroflexota bacterium]
MDEKRTSRDFILDLFENKDEKRYLEYILEEFDEKDIVEKIVTSCNIEGKND